MDKQVAWDLLGAEQVDFVDLLRGLGADQWATPSLCSGWDVRDVAVHAACGRKSVPEALRLWASVGFGSPHKVNAQELETHRDMACEDVVAWMASSIKHKSASDSLNQLRGLMIHQQDIRRPLAIPRTIPAERVIAVLDHGLTRLGDLNLGTRKRAAGLKLVATDIDWSHGEGPAVRGTAEAILMALAGRKAALSELTGDAVEQLSARD